MEGRPEIDHTHRRRRGGTKARNNFAPKELQRQSVAKCARSISTSRTGPSKIRPAGRSGWRPCPISDGEVKRGKELKHRKARMDQRTRERLPVLSQLVRSAADRRAAAAALLVAAQNTEPGEVIAGTDGELRRSLIRRGTGRVVWARQYCQRCSSRSHLRGRGSILGIRHHRSVAAQRYPS